MRILLIRLFIIAIAVYAGVQWWYFNMENRLQPEKQSEKTVELEQENAPPGEEAAELPHVDVREIILKRNIFQAGEEAPAAKSVEQEDSNIDQLEKTQLSLSLLGTVAGEQKDARAIIRDDKTRLEDLFRVGSEIQGAIIKRIARGKVVLLVNGREEVLVIKERDNSAGPSPAPLRPRRPVTLNKKEQSVHSVPRAVPRRRISFRGSHRALPQPEPQELIEIPIDKESKDVVLETSVDDTFDDAAAEMEPAIPLEEVETVE
nr:type II secretion system protein N [uncultured Desulfobulbus sp.]